MPCIRWAVIFGGALFLYLFAYAVGAETSQRLLVAEYVMGTVYVIDTQTHQLIQTLPRESAGAMTFTVGQSSIYFINALFIDEVEKSTLTEIAEFDYEGFCTPGLVRGRITPQGKLYIGVIGWGKEATSGLYQIDLARRSQQKILSRDALTTGLIDLSADGNTLYYARPSGIYALNTQNDAVTQIIPVPKNEHVFDIACGMDRMIYATAYSYPEESSSGNLVLAIDLNKKTQRLQTTQYRPGRLLFAPEGRLYVLDEKTLYVFACPTLDLVYSIPVTGRDMAITADQKKLFVTSPNTAEIRVIDLEKHIVTDTIKIGENPNALQIF